MKLTNRIILLFSLLFTAQLSYGEDSDSTILMRGVLDLGEKKVFSLSKSETDASTWFQLGQSFEGYQLIEYDTEEKLLTLQKGEEKREVKLKASIDLSINEIGTTEERLAEASNIMEVMNFEKMMDETMRAQMKAMSGMIRQQLSANGNLSEEMIAFQTKAMEEMFDELDWQPIKKGLINIYAETFTKAELNSISRFYATPAGQATIEKQPELQHKMMKIMTPMIMSATQSMQQKIIEFHKQQQQ